MNKYLRLALLLCCAYASSCTGKKPIEATDKLVYTIDSFKLGIDGCLGDTCANTSFYYPVFQGPQSDSINTFVAQLLSAPYMDTTENDYKQIAKSFIADFVKEKASDYDGWGWELDRSVVVDTILPKFLTLHLTETIYAGGAHPNSYDSYAHLDRNTLNRLQLKDFLINSDTSALWLIANNQFRKNFKLKADENLEEAGFFFADGKFALSDNAFFNKKGLTFHYNNYEIRSYAEGPYDLEIPYSSLDTLLKKEWLR